MNRQMRRIIAAIVLLGAPLGLAQAPLTPNTEMRMLGASSDVVAYVDAAQSEILLSAYMLRVQSIAEALRRAVVERGVQAYILTTNAGLNEGASYAKSLALAGAHVRSGYANAELLVVDRYYVVNGPLIGVQSMPEGMDPTFAFTGTDYANSLVTIFIEQYNGAAPYDPREVAQ